MQAVTMYAQVDGVGCGMFVFRLCGNCTPKSILRFSIGVVGLQISMQIHWRCMQTIWTDSSLFVGRIKAFWKKCCIPHEYGTVQAQEAAFVTHMHCSQLPTQQSPNCMAEVR